MDQRDIIAIPGPGRTDLKDKVVVVTGSSEGIGKETAIKLSKKRARVVITYNKDHSDALKVLEECRRYSEAMAVHLDVRDNESIKAFRKQVMEKYGGVDVLINNAGVIRQKPFRDHTMEDIDELVRVNLTGLMKVTRAFIRDFLEQDNGVIVNICSVVGKGSYTELVPYGASKHGVRAFTQSLAKELPKSVRTYCVNPSVTATRMTDYQGMPPESVAEVVVAAAEEKLRKNSGDDVDVLDYIR